MNIAEIKAEADIVQVVGGYVQLKKKGVESVGLCPFHDDHKASLNVNFRKQLFYCGACGASGDVFDFLIKYGRTIKEAADELRGISSAANAGKPEQRQAKTTERIEWTQVTPAPKPAQIVHYKHGRPAKSWPYLSPTGELLGLICRFETPEGKQVLPYTFCTDGTRKDWRWQGFASPRPLYGLADIAARPGATVLVVEGEKTADAAQTLLPHIVVTCWQGGAEAVRKTDWTPLTGRKIVLWPDNDKEQRFGSSHPKAGELKPWNEQPGNAAMLEIADILAPTASVVKWVFNHPDFPNKWDVADATWTQDEAVTYVRDNIGNVPSEPWPVLEGSQPDPPVPAEAPPPPVTPDVPPEVPRQDVPENFADDYETYFRFLGYEKEQDGEVLAFYVKEAKIVHKYGSRSLGSVTTLINLAPLDFWQSSFPKKTASRIDGDAAANWLVRSARSAGVFSPSKLRGRGAWIDDGRVVFHAGEALIVDGKTVELGQIKTRYIYEAGENLQINTAAVLDNVAAHKLLEICALVNWERSISAQLLAGWCVVAPICGALPWRPHIWITGPAGTGKTWVFQKVVRRMLGRGGVMVQGETSEAGVRQTLGVDALPVVFDEAEGEDKRAADRIQSILGLVRSASAEDGGFIVKGSAAGGVKNYRIRSCFAFASIALSLKQQSDRTRVTVLSIVRNHDEEKKNARWVELQKIHAETVTDQFCDALQARTLALLPTILDNAKTFAAAAASVLQDQRAGDQLGPLLAGAFSLSSTGKINFDDAVAWIRKRDWTQERDLDESRDENRLLGFLLDYITRVDGNGMVVERSIGELITIASGAQLDATVSQDAAQNRLKRLGMKVDSSFLVVSNNGAQITKILQNTPWAVNHGRILERLEGSVKMTAQRFAGNLPLSRAVAIPFHLFTG